MTFKPGVSGNPSGKRKQLLRRPDEVLHELGLSPVEEILKLMPDLKTADQLKAWLELLAYCHSKPKEISVDIVNSPLSALTDDELLRLVREPLIKPKQLPAVG